MDNRIKEEIKNSITTYQIKTTSQDIMNKYYAKQSKMNFFKKKILLPVSFLCVCSIIAVISMVSLINNNQDKIIVENQSNKLNDSSLLANISLKLSIGKQFIVENDNSFSKKAKFNNKVTDDDFMYSVEKIEKIFPTYSAYLNEKEGLEYSLKKVKFTYLNNSYQYQLTTKDAILYLNNDLSKEVKKYKEDIVINFNDDNFYIGELKIKNKDDEVETEITYSIDEYTYKIQKDIESLSYGIETIVYKNNHELYNYSLSFDYEDDEFEFEYEYENKETEYEIEISFKEKKGKILIDFEEKSSERNLDLSDIILTLENNSRIYEYENKKIIK